MIKKLSIAILCILVSFSLTGCYVHKAKARPDKQLPSLWICDEPYIEIEFYNDFHDIYDDDGNFIYTDFTPPRCTLNINGELSEFEVEFSVGYDMIIRDSNDNYIHCICDFNKDNFIAKVYEDDIFNNKYEKFIFNRAENN